MNYESILLFTSLFVVVIPFFFWFRIRYVNKRRDSVRSRCANCGQIDRLDNIHNYNCSQCGQEVIYIDLNGDRLKDNTYNCKVCSTTNLVGIMDCTICGKKID